MLEGEKKHIKQAKKGNKEAFGLLYDHYLPKIYRFIFLKTTNQAEAEDLAHEVFLNAWQSMYRYKDEGFPFSSWLYQIAKNAVIDFYRTSKKNIQLELVNEELVKIDASYPENLDAAMVLEKLQKNIQLLKSDYQDVLIMRFIEDMSHEEIAAILHKSEGATRLIQHRALKDLKSLYEANNPQNNNGTTTLEA